MPAAAAAAAAADAHEQRQQLRGLFVVELDALESTSCAPALLAGDHQ
ncbi:MAG: hypothetical protein ACK4F6_19545 [Hylemonella sp.]